MNLESTIIQHCCPTLAGLKTAGLFTIKYEDITELETYITKISSSFITKGISIKIVKKKNNTALIYMYRKNMLELDLSNLLAKKILMQNGYCDFNVENAIELLSKRLNAYDEFPHEIGLFLGYPPKDVEGFICNKGQNCNLCKYWKVYGNEEEAIIKFARYDKCKLIYKKLWQEGRDILQLTVNKQVVA